MTVTKSAQDNLLGLSSRMGDFVNMISDRDDLITSVSRDVNHRGMKHPAAAYYTPARAEVCFDSGQFFPTDEEAKFLDPYDHYTRMQHTGFVGAAVHEAAHAAHTRFSIPNGTNPQVAHWLMNLEESRCEAQHLARRPHDAPLLRGTVFQIVAPDVFQPKSQDKDSKGVMGRGQAAQLAGLILARVDTGILTEDLVSEVRAEIATALGEDDLQALNALWIENQGIADDDIDALLDVATRWTEVVARDVPTDTPEEQSGKSEEQGEKEEEGESSDSGSEDQEDADKGEGEDSGEEQDSDSADSNDESGDSDSDSDDDSDSNSGEEGTHSDEDSDEDSQGKSGDSSGEKEDIEEEAPAQRLPCGSWTAGDLPEDAEEEAEGEDSEQSDTDSEEEKEEEEEANTEEEEADLAKKMKNLFKRAIESAQEEIEEEDAAGKIQRTPIGVSDKKAEERARANVTHSANQKVFVQPSFPSRYGGEGTTVHYETPNADDKAQARALIHALRKAQYRDVARTLVASETPPGRMRMSEVARRDAQVQRGETINATPWRQMRRREVQQPPFTLGVSIDVSGSLNRIQRPVSSMAWALSQAAKHVEGTVAVAAWNHGVSPVIKPGNFPTQVPIAASRGMSSGCALSIQALDGALNLRKSEGVRMLVIVSDGGIEKRPHVQHEIDTLRKAGVIVIWANVMENSPWIPKNTHVIQVDQIDNFGRLLGKALVDALASHGK